MVSIIQKGVARLVGLRDYVKRLESLNVAKQKQYDELWKKYVEVSDDLNASMNEVDKLRKNVFSLMGQVSALKKKLAKYAETETD